METGHPVQASRTRAAAGAALSAVSALALLAGCATTNPRPIGAIVPMEGGSYRSEVKSDSLAQATKAFVHDAELTCGGAEAPSRLPWAAKTPPVAKYVVVSQTNKTTGGKEIEAENKNVQAGIAAGLRYLRLESKESVEITTVFKCT